MRRLPALLAVMASSTALERVSTLLEARAPRRPVSAATQRCDPLQSAVDIEGFLDVAFPRVEDAWAASLGASIWPSALATACLAHHAAPALLGKNVLELGSGLGLGGLACAAAGADVVLTDFDEALVAALEETCDARPDCAAAALDWADPATYVGDSFDLVIGADVAYESAVVPDLLAAVDAHLDQHGVAMIVGERKRNAMRVLRDALPPELGVALDYDLVREVTGGAGDARPQPEAFGIAVLVFAKERPALDAFLAHLELSEAGLPACFSMRRPAG